MDPLSNTEVQKQFNVYRRLIQNAITIEKDISFNKQYSSHLEWLDKIENAFNNNDTVLLKNLIEQESRSYGWSYLPNDYGEKVESAFWKLKRLICG